ncbi:transcriptional regulator [Streptomyces viridiviolaceus]|uniref:AraC family transcriptional regulator n=1 Tax=Streptomyces viridiviolaceus TaxID=68282 RepID=A0ABW2ECH7_9ACTN|nr:AraC family transcriptional regulator [Streptomyces viridiviolaceus]GHB73913.1 transcriptional regulator [Streptomyces viridiviolaceus]
MSTDRQTAQPGPRLRFRTTDLDIARTQVTKTFAEHDMSVGDRATLDCRLDLTPSGRLTLARLGYGTDVTIFGPPMRSVYHVNLPVSGASTVQQNGTTRTSTAGRSGIAMLPNGPVTMWWSPDGVQYAIKLPKELLEAHAAKLTGRPVDGGIRFALEFDLSSAPGQMLNATVSFLYAELLRPDGLATMPTVRHELESALMTQLLMTIPSQLSETLHGKPAHSRRTRIMQVVEYIDEHPHLELSTADLAAVAGIGERSLQAGFRDLVGMSPRAYVRVVRLDRVHLELSTGTPESVTDVAARWGFFHPGRFAQQYRDRFGVLPSDTVRSAR